MGNPDERTSEAHTEEATSARTCCASCGSAIDTSDWYPVTTDRDSDGTLRLHSFCSDACQEAWRDGRTDEPADARSTE